jgi:pyruvate dehydrogenase E1 component beta subunit
LIDLRSVNPIDWDTIFESVKRTGRLLVLDTANETGSVAGEIIARVATQGFDLLKTAPKRVCLPDYPTPTSPALTEGFYRGAKEVLTAVSQLMGRALDAEQLLQKKSSPHDVPGAWFKGPF